jgi:hypothetical protein
MNILIVLLVSYFLILDPAYSQQNAASTTTTTDLGPSQQESNISIKIVVFLILSYAAGQFIRD